MRQVLDPTRLNSRTLQSGGVVEIVPSPLLVLEEERKRFQLRVDHLMYEFSSPSSPVPLVSSGLMSEEDAELEDKLCLVPVP